MDDSVRDLEQDAYPDNRLSRSGDLQLVMLSRQELTTASFPHPTGVIAVRETPLSLIVLTGEYAYKIKKAVKLDYLDTRSLDRRRELCLEELRLNGRYAPELYLALTPIVRTAAGLCFGGEAEPIEYAVCMRQFDAADELHALVEAHRIEASEVRALARRIALAHREAPSSAAPPQATRSFERIVLANLASIERSASLLADDSGVDTLLAWVRERLARAKTRLMEREREGCVRECHGDLHARNVVRWRGALTPFDCLEFEPALRTIDTLSDASFLTMDLIHLGRTDLAYSFLNGYLESSGDYLGLDLLPLFLVHLALVRAKVDLIEVSQHPHAPEARDRAERRLATARRLTRRGPPTLIVMHGASGSGKSWLSERIAPAFGAVRIRSDVERKRLVGVDPLTPHMGGLDEGWYAPEMHVKTYARLGECARACLRGGLHAIVDAASLKREERDAFAALAKEEAARFVILSCAADPTTLAARIAARRAEPTDPSDATQTVLERQLQTMKPLEPDEAASAVQIDTRASDALEQALSALNSRSA